ncbi:uncharacterized protein LTR77_004922 [Saxophila tyrrhenica]|uniref:Dol-P-Man:Man(5)GlcNAc(2)-PP-Dol alpha-1,3-mannosyltransferase n=1 Tax=Saxophila tyrrhenica TaxID=1690608 RepID=A0AAV9PB81_9PEZI|nr:hypothetical protein LTR77_004922 [Saxophila tyrrhenica]
MSKLSEPLKALINASHAKPNTLPAPRHIASVYERVANGAREKGVGLKAWLTASAAATFTLNSPDSLLELYKLANDAKFKRNENHGVWTAELMREIGLKCIGLNGVPRTINCLGAFYAGLPSPIRTELQSRPARRALHPKTITETTDRGNWLWDRIYHPFTDKLTAKLAQSHPDLPVFIIEGEYGALFTDPASPPLDLERVPNVGRVTTSIMAISVLRAQTGVGPQVVSHIFGLRKAFEDGTAQLEEVEGGEWLSGNEGSEWLLGEVDRIVQELGGSTFAPGMEKEARAKL